VVEDEALQAMDSRGHPRVHESLPRQRPNLPPSLPPSRLLLLLLPSLLPSLLPPGRGGTSGGWAVEKLLATERKAEKGPGMK
jgi:hypothetical protein